MAERIGQEKRRCDVAGQYGLHGFMMLLPQSSELEARGACNRLRALLDHPPHPDLLALLNAKRAAGVVVETDGAATHLTARAFEADRARDAELGAAGYRVIRFTWRQICDRPRWVAHTLGEILTAS